MHRSLPVRRSGLAVLLLVLAPLTGQARRPLAGLVTDATGAPTAATVMLVGTTSPENWLGPPDVLTVTSGADGRFRTTVLDCVEYSAWAFAGEPDGRRRVSQLSHGHGPGPRLELRLGQPVTVPGLHLSGIESLVDRAPLRVRCRPEQMPNWAVEAPLATDGSAALPPAFPPGPANVELLATDGTPLWVIPVDAAGRGELPPPRTVKVRVTAADQQPVAGATVTTDLRHGAQLPLVGHASAVVTVTLGITGADGTAVLAVPSTERNPRPLELRASKSGHATGYGGWTSEGTRFWPAKGEPAPALPEDEVAIRLPALRQVTFEVVAPDGQPLVDCPILVSLVDDVAAGEHVYWNMDRMAKGTTDAAGRFLAGLGRDSRVNSVRLGPQALQRLVLPTETPRGFPPGQPLFLAPDTTSDTVRLELGAPRRLRLDVRDPSGGPATGALAVLLPKKPAAKYPDAHDLRFRLDAAGRAELLMEPGAWWLFVGSTDWFLWQEIKVGTEAAVLSLQLEPWPRARFRAIDAEGQPVADARLGWTTYSFRFRPGQETMQLDLLLVQMLQRQLPTVRSAADGTFSVPFVASSGLEMLVEAVAGERRSLPWHLNLTEDQVDVVLK